MAKNKQRKFYNPTLDASPEWFKKVFEESKKYKIKKPKSLRRK